jgi:hypothetical protein
MDDQNFEGYRLARAEGRHIQVKAGDKVPIRMLDVEVVSGGKTYHESPIHRQETDGYKISSMRTVFRAIRLIRSEYVRSGSF